MKNSQNVTGRSTYNTQTIERLLRIQYGKWNQARGGENSCDERLKQPKLRQDGRSQEKWIGCYSEDELVREKEKSRMAIIFLR